MTINQFLEKYYSLELQLWDFQYPDRQDVNQHFKDVTLDVYEEIADRLNIDFRSNLFENVLTELEALNLRLNNSTNIKASPNL